MFLNVLMLAGVGAAVIPLVLHLLSRSRYRNVDWGAMMFLQGVDVRQRQSARLSQWLLMAMRMALVALLAVALARPVVRRDWAAAGAAGGDPRATAVLVLDASASMAYDENGRSRMDLARGAALQVLAALRPGDRAALVTMGRPQSEAEMRPTTDLRDIANRLQAVQPGTGTAGLPDGLERALNAFDPNDPGPRDIYVIADRQALTWTSADERFQAEWRDRLARAGRPGPRLFALPVGSLAADNVSIDSVTLPNGPAVRGQEAEVEVRLTNRGDARRASLPLALALNGAPVARTTVDLAPNAVTAVRLALTFPKAGSQVLTASIKTAGLTTDDRYDAAVDVAEPIRVLVLSGDERAGNFRGESDFLRLALAPYATSGIKPAGAGDPADVTVLPVDRWHDVELSRFQVVVLANIERFDEQQVRALEQYVYGGGGLLVAPGGLSRPADYNQQLYRGGAGILPAELFPPTPADGSGATTLVGYEPNHPIFRFLRGRPDPFPNATVGRYFPAGVRQSSGVALAYFLSGDPFLVESAAASAGRGRVLLMTTPLDADWSTLPLSNFYLPFMQSVVRYLAGGTVEDRNLKPGDPIRVLLDEPNPSPAATTAPIAAEDEVEDSRTATLTRPDRPQPIDLPVLPYGAGEVRYADTFAPGVYRVTIKDARDAKNPRTVHFVVHPPPDESDLTPMTEAQWRWLANGLNLTRVEPEAPAFAAAIQSGRDGKELWGVLLGGVLALGIAEIALSRRWAQKDV